jgi:GH15 family glucan-1,4-alpha-glucosidase
MWELADLRQYTASKVSVWTALDRAIRLAEEGQLPVAHLSRWREERRRLRDWIEANAWSEELGAYRGWAGDDTLDAAVLRAVRQRYPERERLARTVDAISDRLRAAPGLVYRSSEHVGEEGAFVACSFWVAEALARLDRADEASEWFEAAVGYANDVGLLSEQVDPGSGELLGNFPQGLSHLALINAAGAIEDAASRGGVPSATEGAARR